MFLHRVAAIVILLASFPLMVFATECGFGLAATLMVPTCCLGYWFALTSPQRSHRLGWFAFSSINVFLLPFCPWWKRVIEAGLHAFQLLVRDVQPSFLYHNAEIVALLLIIILPWGVGCGLGRFVAKLTRRFVSESPTHTVSERSIFFQFSVRGMLLTIMVFAFLTGWLSTTVRKWYAHEKANQQLLLRRFQDSFTSGNVTLLAEPFIAKDHSVFQRNQKADGISEYRIVAPIKKGGNQRWAVWLYLCNEKYPGSVSNFGYGEAGTQNALPRNIFPEYLREPTYSLVDGEPEVSTLASIVEAPTAARSGETITIVAKTNEYMMCDLIIRPFQAVTLPPETLTAPESGVVRWDIVINPAYVGKSLEYEFQTRLNNIYRAKQISGKVTLTQKGDEQTDTR